MERDLRADQYNVLCDKLFQGQGFHNRFVDFARHITANCHLMLTAVWVFVLTCESYDILFLLTWFHNPSPVSNYNLRTSS